MMELTSLASATLSSGYSASAAAPAATISGLKAVRSSASSLSIGFPINMPVIFKRVLSQGVMDRRRLNRRSASGLPWVASL